MTAERELRLALAMRGGVSLAVWIGGCVQEIDRLRWDVVRGPDPSRNALARLAKDVGIGQVTVDVMSGASAGGLNAVIYGTAMAAGVKVDELRHTWMKIADIEQLQQLAGFPKKDEPSLLDGEYFREQLGASLQQLVAAGEEKAKANRDRDLAATRLDVLLSVSSLDATETRTVLDPALPEVERRIEGMVHLYHHDGVSDFVGAAVDRETRIEVLKTAGRSTAAFPVAFAPQLAGTGLKKRLEMRPRQPDRVMLYDGGVTDNMPVGKASRLIEAAPADGPTSRVLLYLHPSPGAKDDQEPQDPDRLASPLDVIKSAAGSLRAKSLAEDLRTIKAHNASIGAQLGSRERLLQPEPLPPPEVGAIPSLDAARLADLLSFPWDHLDGIVPLPAREEPLLEGRSGDFERELVLRVRERLQYVREMAAANKGVDPVLPVLAVGSVRPWSPIIRAASLLIEWFNRYKLDAAGGDTPKARLYEIRANAYLEASRLNQDTLDALRQDAEGSDKSAESWAEDLVARRLEQIVRRKEWEAIETAWADLCRQALLIRRSAEHPPAEADRVEFTFTDRAVMGIQLTTDEITKTSLRQAARVLNAIDRALLPLHRGPPWEA